MPDERVIPNNANIPLSDVIFSGRPESLDAFRAAVADAVNLLKRVPKPDSRPFIGGSHGSLSGLLNEPFEQALKSPSRDAANRLLELAIEGCVPPFHPLTAAHLHTPVLNASIKAEIIISALNQSMDSLDQSGLATLMELKLMDWLADLAGFPRDSFGGTMTSGGTMSNYFACLLALHSYLRKAHAWDARTNGLPPHLHGKLFILTSEISHFSIEKAALQLGLGTSSVIKIPVDLVTFQIRPDAVSSTLSSLRASGNHPFLLVGTASTTDFGSFDPLDSLASIAAAHPNLWLHVDAAYGSACLLSPLLRANLAGIEKADSVTMDFHKAFFQPISCGALLVKHKTAFGLANVYSDYLNSEERSDEGIPDLVNYSLMTTRRFDALKVITSISEIGAEEMGRMVERLKELAVWCADEMVRRKGLEGKKGALVPLHSPAFGCLVFRYLPFNASDDSKVDRLNGDVPRVLFERGWAVLGHTKVRGSEAIKITVNSPAVTEEEMGRLVDVVEKCAEELWSSGRLEGR